MAFSERQRQISRSPLDAAVPDKVMIYRPFLLAVTVRQPQSPVLNEEDLKKTATADLHVVWPHSEGFIRLLIDVSAPDCITIARDHLTFRLNRDQDSPIFYFPLTPKREGLITIIITLLYDNDGIASSRLKTTSYSEVIGEVHIQTQTSMNTFSKEQHFIERELDILNRRLQHLQIAKSYKGINTEPEVLMEIEDIEKEMYRLRDQMEKYRY